MNAVYAFTTTLLVGVALTLATVYAVDVLIDSDHLRKSQVSETPDTDPREDTSE